MTCTWNIHHANLYHVCITPTGSTNCIAHFYFHFTGGPLRSNTNAVYIDQKSHGLVERFLVKYRVILIHAWYESLLYILLQQS